MQSIYMDENRSIADLSDLGDGRWEINRINVLATRRGRGDGRALLKRVLEDADAEGATLELSVFASGREGVDPDLLGLFSWYQRNNFNWKPDSGLRMERFPTTQSEHSTPTTHPPFFHHQEGGPHGC